MPAYVQLTFQGALFVYQDEYDAAMRAVKAAEAESNLSGDSEDGVSPKEVLGMKMVLQFTIHLKFYYRYRKCGFLDLDYDSSWEATRIKTKLIHLPIPFQLKLNRNRNLAQRIWRRCTTR